MMELIKVENSAVVLDRDIVNRILSIELLKKQVKEEEENIKTDLLKAMEDHEVIKIETEELIINYVAATDREYFNSKKLREDKPELYDDYVTIRPVKPSLRFKVK